MRPWYESGFRYLGAAAVETGLYLILPFFFYALLRRWRRHRDASYALVLLAVCAHMAYLLRIGGDHFEYRPLDFYWPLLSLPAADGILLVGSKLSDIIIRHPRIPKAIAGRRAAILAVFLLTLLYANSLQAVLLFEATKLAGRLPRSYFEINQENAA